jgi:hypothetical protein
VSSAILTPLSIPWCVDEACLVCWGYPWTNIVSPESFSLYCPSLPFISLALTEFPRLLCLQHYYCHHLKPYDVHFVFVLVSFVCQVPVPISLNKKLLFFEVPYRTTIDIFTFPTFVSS